jgi:hypothetical protein
MGLPKDERHFTGSVGTGTGGVRDRYTPELDRIAKARSATQLNGEAAAGKPSRLARIRLFRRRLLWEL